MPITAFLVALTPPLAGVAGYAKSKRLAAGDYDATLDDRSIAGHPRSSLRIEREVDISSYFGAGFGLGGEPSWRREAFFGLYDLLAPEAGFFDAPSEFRFCTGHSVDWRHHADANPSIRLLVLAASDVDTKRNGIWGVKRRHRAVLQADWVAVLTRTRNGSVRA